MFKLFVAVALFEHYLLFWKNLGLRLLCSGVDELVVEVEPLKSKVRRRGEQEATFALRSEASLKRRLELSLRAELNSPLAIRGI